MRNECNIIRDILPLYVEDMVSTDTADFVEEHLEKCNACRAELKTLKQSNGIEKAFDDVSDGRAAMKALQNKLRKRSIWNVLSGIIISVVLLALVLTAYSYFRVDGDEIVGVTEISNSCTVTLIQYQHLAWEDRTEYKLNNEQVMELKNLIQTSSFTRVLSSTVTFDDRDRYDIQIDFNNGQNFLSISCIGNEYISIVNQFDGKHLKVKNSQWENVLLHLIEDASKI